MQEIELITEQISTYSPASIRQDRYSGVSLALRPRFPCRVGASEEGQLAFLIFLQLYYSIYMTAKKLTGKESRRGND
jgi:hypothetical protein